MKRGWEGLVIKAFGGRDFRLTVLGTEPVNDHYHRLHLDGGGLLEACGVHPTMWIRLWFDDDGKPHQRAYTLVDPDPADRPVQPGVRHARRLAARWAHRGAGRRHHRRHRAGQRRSPCPTRHPEHLYAIGDAASLPAVNSLFDAAGDVPATVWLEYAHEAEKDAAAAQPGPPHRHAGCRAGRRAGIWSTRSARRCPRPDGACYWVGGEASSARAIAKHIRRDLGVDKHRLSALGYWNATR